MLSAASIPAFIARTDAIVLIRDPRNVSVTLCIAQQGGGNADGTRGIDHMDHGTFVVGSNLDRRVDLRRRRTADQKRNRETSASHLRRNDFHFPQRRRDKAGEPDHIGLLLLRRFQDLGVRHHYPEIDDFKVVALEHHADNVLADVVHIPLHGRGNDLAFGQGLAAILFFGFEIRG